jgi:hypothetical protein
MALTPMSTVIRSVAQFVEDESLTGVVAEIHDTDITFAQQPLFVDEGTAKNMDMFWNLCNVTLGESGK